jgi:predicted P-loop ATPase
VYHHLYTIDNGQDIRDCRLDVILIWSFSRGKLLHFEGGKTTEETATGVFIAISADEWARGRIFASGFGRMVEMVTEFRLKGIRYAEKYSRMIKESYKEPLDGGDGHSPMRSKTSGI